MRIQVLGAGGIGGGLGGLLHRAGHEVTLIARGAPQLFRVHEEPAPEKLDSLREVARASGIWSHSDLTRGLASEELETRAMLRRVVWRTDQGAGIGRLTLAEPDRVLVACTDDVPRSQTSATLALRPKDPGAPGVDLQVRVTGSGPRLLANRPGFDAEITGFDDAASYERYERLVGWVARNVTWRAP
mgnify:CR=1 FL=1